MSNTAEATARTLVTLEPKNAYEIFTGGTDAIQPILNLIRAQIDQFVPDVTTEEGRDEVKAFAYRITRSKTYLDEAGKELTDKAKEIPKKIDANRKFARDTLDAWRDEVRAPLDQWEAAEKERVERVKLDLAELQGVIDDQQERPSEVLRDRLAEIMRDEPTAERYAEFIDAAIELRDGAIATLNKRIEVATKREADAAELAELRKFKEAAEAQRIKEQQAERDEQLRQEGIRAAEERAAKALQDERDAAAQREADLKRKAEEADQRAEAAAKEAAEKARREVEEKARRDAEAKAQREQDVEHKRAINRAALDALVAGGIGEKTARKVVELIAQGAVPAVSIQY